MHIPRWLDKAAVLSVTLIFSLGLLYLAVPRTVAALLALSGDSVYRRIEAHEKVSRADLRELVKSRIAVARWVGQPRAWTDMAVAQLLIAFPDDNKNSAPDPAMLDQAIQALKDGLARSPTDPNAWARLALAQYYRNGPTADLAPPLTMSILTGPFKPEFLVIRLDLALRVWSHLPPDSRNLVFQQVRFAWRRYPKETTALATGPVRTGIIRAALAATPEALARFEAALRKRDRKG